MSPTIIASARIPSVGRAFNVEDSAVVCSVWCRGCGSAIGTAASMRPGRAHITTTRLATTIAFSVSWVTKGTVLLPSRFPGRRFFPARTPIAVAKGFAEIGSARNVTSATHVEALIDGVGAAVVRARRSFLAP